MLNVREKIGAVIPPPTTFPDILAGGLGLGEITQGPQAKNPCRKPSSVKQHVQHQLPLRDSGPAVRGREGLYRVLPGETTGLACT